MEERESLKPIAGAQHPRRARLSLRAEFALAVLVGLQRCAVWLLTRFHHA